jgi:MFS family permease
MTMGTFRMLVLLAAGPGLIGVLLVVLFIRDQAASGEKRKPPRLSLKGYDRRFKAFLAITVVFTLGNSSDAFLILRAQQIGLSLVEIMVLLALFNLLTALVAVPAGILSDRIGRTRVIIAGWLIYGAVYLGFAFVTRAWQIWGLYILYGAYYGATEGVGKALVADVVMASEKRGTAFGLYNAAVGISALPASFIAGLLWQKWGPAAPFLFGAGLSLAAVAALAVLLRARRPAPEL